MTPEEVEFELRREWWINHGHGYHSLYGDDGEMQCGRCLVDFKRDPLERLKEVVFMTRTQRLSEENNG